MRGLGGGAHRIKRLSQISTRSHTKLGHMVNTCFLGGYFFGGCWGGGGGREQCLINQTNQCTSHWRSRRICLHFSPEDEEDALREMPA